MPDVSFPNSLWRQRRLRGEAKVARLYHIEYSSLPGMETAAPAVEAWSPNHWTGRDVPKSNQI